MSFCHFVGAVAILAVCLVLPSMQADPCVSSCVDVTNGDYQSCNGCNVYVTCSNGITYDNRPCPGGLIWDDNLKRCDWASDTCPPQATMEKFDKLNSYQYIESSLDFSSKTHLLVNIQSSGYARVGLQEKSGDHRGGWSKMYEILFGWGRYSYIYGYVQEIVPDMLNADEMRPFWISWENGVISVGRGHVVGQDQFISYTDPSPRPVNVVAVTADNGREASFELISD